MRFWSFAAALLLLVGGLGVGNVRAADAPTVVTVKVSGDEGQTMTLEAAPGSVKAGRVTFRVENGAKTEPHEVIVARVNDLKAPLPYDEGKHRVIESKLQALGEVSDVKPGKSKSMTLTLKPGKYVLLCNLRGHYKAGMTAPFEVTG
jgi:uncharacterized cupredoxin-like copper-binding protein